MAGPGEYVADVTEGIVRVEDLPPPRIERRRRVYRRRRCPFCGGKARRCGMAHRVLHDLGDARGGWPVDIHLTYSTHQCSWCRRCFNTDMDDLALPKCHYTHRARAASGAAGDRRRPALSGGQLASLARPPSLCALRHNPELGRGGGGKKANGASTVSTWTGLWPRSAATWRPTRSTTGRSAC